MALLVTPFALRQLGDARFGIWALAGALLALLRLLDLGLSRALTRRIARLAVGELRGASDVEDRALSSGFDEARYPSESPGSREDSDIQAAMATARGLSLILGGLGLVLVWILTPPLVDQVFRLDPSLRAEARYVLIGTALVAWVEVAFAPYQAAMEGIGRMDLSNAIDALVQRLLSPLGVVLVLAAGWGLPGLIWKNLAMAILAGLWLVLALARRAPDLAAGLPRFDPARAKDLLGFGRHVQAVNLASALVEPVAKALLGRHAGLLAVTQFELAGRMAGQLGSAFMALSNALFPAAAELAARGDRPTDKPALRRLHHQASRHLAWLILPTWLIFIALAAPFVEAWIGPGYPSVSRAAMVLAGGWLLALLALPAFLVAQAGGREGLSTRSGLITAGLSIGLSFLLAPRMGLGGIAIALATGLGAGGLCMLWLFAGWLEGEGRGEGAAEGIAEGIAVVTAEGAAEGIAVATADGAAKGSAGSGGARVLGRRHGRLVGQLGQLGRLSGAGWRVWIAASAGALLARALSESLPLHLAGVALAGLVGLGLAAALLLQSGEIGPEERGRLGTWLRAGAKARGQA
jgi:O-antigen/teichoic acid export membrane protein